MNRSLVANNVAGRRGGAVYLAYSNKPITLTGSIFTHNTAQTGAGGAIYTDASLNGVSIDGTVFVANVAQVVAPFPPPPFLSMNTIFISIMTHPLMIICAFPHSLFSFILFPSFP